MKSKENIGRFFTMFRPETIQDEELLKVYFGKRRMRISFHTDHPDYLSRPTVSYDQAVYWMNSHSPDIGDVIRVAETGRICLITDQTWDSFAAGAILSDSGDLRFEKACFTHESDWTPATDDEILLMQRFLSQKDLTWNQSTGRLERREIPAPGSFVRLMRMGKKVGTGIFKNVSEDGLLEMFCVKFDNKALMVAVNLNIGDAVDYSFSKAWESERAEIHELLHGVKLIWRPRKKCLDRDKGRVKIGQKYWYLNSNWLVKQATENDQPKDREKSQKGNYFKKKESADMVRARIIIYSKEVVLQDE